MSKYEVVGYKSKGCWLYSDKVKSHFFEPRNIFKSKKEEAEWEKKADGIGEVGSPACGDVMRFYIKVKRDRIVDCRWMTYGCASALASTSVLSEMVQGMTLAEAKRITPKDIVTELGGLPPRKIHCSVLGDQALRKAIEDYESKQEQK